MSLDGLLKKTSDSKPQSLLPDELTYILDTFLPSNPSTDRTKAYLVLTAFCQGVRASNKQLPNHATESLTRIFGPPTVSRITDLDESRSLSGISFLTALFQVDWEPAAAIFQQDGVYDAVLDNVDVSPSPSMSLNVAHLLGQAVGHKPLRSIMTSQATEWLKISSRQATDTSLRTAAAVASVKYFMGLARDSETTPAESQPQVSPTPHGELTALLKSIIVDQGNPASVPDAVEGLAYLSTDPNVKEELSSDSTFLSRLFALVPRKKKAASVIEAEEQRSTLLYGVLSIVTQICSYRPRLTEEQAQIEKLRGMAKGKKASTREAVLTDDEHVKRRVHRMVAAGVIDVLVSASAPGVDTPGVRASIGSTMLYVVEDKENRGKVLQGGGAKALTQIIKRALSDHPKSNPSLDPGQLAAIQALAKLAITASPVQVFGPNEGAMYDAIRPFSVLLQQTSSSLLQRFEALMALTNLASQSAELSSRISAADGLMNRVEFLMLEEHPLVRRAATELVCNLIAGSDSVFERYGALGSSSKLQILVALSDVEDLPTRLAASGALATVTISEIACQHLVQLQLEKNRVLPILTQLIDATVVGDDDKDAKPHPGLIHRGVICVRNLLLSIKDSATKPEIIAQADAAGLTKALQKTLEGSVDAAIANPATETLAFLRNQ
ncbi:hypothetical protein HGRIS_008297 [Hohenbuehelia grisea]|uniref:UNC-45/Cro1/She4 central domain-containing protein n=1 Tax=Hohenbuehelia grisea TaxID=104357 RepID=A0ABR3J7J0_9AGAR